MATPAPAPTLDVIDVLTRTGGDRERLGTVVGEQLDDLDALLVSDVLRTAGRVGDTLALRHELVRLCAILRSVDAAERGLIDAVELRAGLRVAAATTDRFEAFAGARVLLRTLLELLDRDESAPLEGPLRSQISLLHAELRAFVLQQLLGSTDGELAAVPAPRSNAAPSPLDAYAVTDHARARAHDALVEELLHGADHHPVTGLLGAAWMRDWSAVPIAGEQLAEEDPGAVARLLSALVELPTPPSSLVLVALRPKARWHLQGRALVVGDGLRPSWRLPVSREALQLVAATRTQWCALTTPGLDFAVVEGAGHHALLGPAALVTRACAMPPLEAIARFREHVEALADDDGDPPPELLAVAESFGRLRRRSR